MCGLKNLNPIRKLRVCTCFHYNIWMDYFGTKSDREEITICQRLYNVMFEMMEKRFSKNWFSFFHKTATTKLDKCKNLFGCYFISQHMRQVNVSFEAIKISPLSCCVHFKNIKSTLLIFDLLTIIQTFIHC